MKERVLSGLILAPLLIIVFLGGWPLLIGCILLSIFGLKEFYNGFSKLGIKPNYMLGYISIPLLYMITFFKDQANLNMLWLFAMTICSLIYLFNITDRKLEDAMATILGIVYVVFFLFHVILIENIPNFAPMIWLVLLIAFGTDTMAYFSGYLFGKHKLCPNISPKKTVEGAIGGIIGSVLFCGIFGYFLFHDYLIHCLVLGFLGSMIAQLGDLTASIFKRKMGIKDYGNLIPGHGGILDRFDSVLFTGPFVYYYITIFII